MFSSIRESIPFSIFQSRKDGDVDRAITDMTWTSLVNMMSKHEVRGNKHGASIVPVRWKPRDQWVLSQEREDENHTPTFRNKENVEAITIAIIDLDKEGALQTAKDVLTGFEYFIYSTHSYTLDTPHKFRAVIKLDQPIPAEKWPLAFNCLIKQIDADKQCGNADRLYYLPAVSPKAGIPAVFEHFRGRTITFDDILKMGGDNAEELLLRKNADRVSKRHFAGVESPELSIAQKLHWTWGAMLLRNKTRVEDLKSSDSRHGFALRTIGLEIQRYKEEVNVEHLVSFLYKAALEFSSKPMNRGNTPREIPEHIESALRKYCKGDNPLRRFEEINGMPLKLAVDMAIRKAEVSQATGNWVVDEKIEVNTQSEQVPTVAEMRLMQKVNMLNLVEHKDQQFYALSCLETYINSGKVFKADIFAAFVVSTFSSFTQKYNASAPKEDILGSFVGFDYQGHMEDKPGSQYARFIRPAMRKAVESALNNNNNVAMSR